MHVTTVDTTPRPSGFPSPAADYHSPRIQLDQMLVSHPEATFLMRASGHSLRNFGIFDGDVLVIDRSLTPKTGSVIVAVVQGEMTVRIFQTKKPEPELIVWGVVRYAVHKL